VLLSNLAQRAQSQRILEPFLRALKLELTTLDFLVVACEFDAEECYDEHDEGVAADCAELVILFDAM